MLEGKVFAVWDECREKLCTSTGRRYAIRRLDSGRVLARIESCLRWALILCGMAMVCLGLLARQSILLCILVRYNKCFTKPPTLDTLVPYLFRLMQIYKSAMHYDMLSLTLGEKRLG